MQEQDPEGYASRQSAASKKANQSMKKSGKGVWSKEQHIKAEITKLQNGTSLSNQEFRKRIGCNGNTEEVIQRQKMLKIGIFRDDIRNNHKPGLCTKCGKFCQHRNAFGIGIECGCLANFGYAKNFITKDNVRYYKSENLEELCEKLLSGEENIDNYLGFEIRFGRVTYQRMGCSY